MVVFLEVPRHECSILHIPAKLCCNNLGRLGFFTETFAIVEWLFKVFARVDSNMWPMDLGFPALVFFLCSLLVCVVPGVGFASYGVSRFCLVYMCTLIWSRIDSVCVYTYAWLYVHMCVWGYSQTYIYTYAMALHLWCLCYCSFLLGCCSWQSSSFLLLLSTCVGEWYALSRIQ